MNAGQIRALPTPETDAIWPTTNRKEMESLERRLAAAVMALERMRSEQTAAFDFAYDLSTTLAAIKEATCKE